MYIQPKINGEQDIRIPENYSGNAFSGEALPLPSSPQLIGEEVKETLAEAITSPSKQTTNRSEIQEEKEQILRKP